MVLFFVGTIEYIKIYLEKKTHRTLNHIRAKFIVYKEALESDLGIHGRIINDIENSKTISLTFHLSGNLIRLRNSDFGDVLLEFDFNIELPREIYGILKVEAVRNASYNNAMYTSSEFFTGDDTFDKKFRIRNTNKSNLITFFTYDLRKYFLNIMSIINKCDMSNSKIEGMWTFKSRKIGADKIIDLIKSLKYINDEISLVEFSVARCINSLKNENNPRVIINIIKYLSSETLSENNIKVLKKLLHHEDRNVQIYASGVTGEAGYKHAIKLFKREGVYDLNEIKVLIQIILQKDNPEVVKLICKKYKLLKNYKTRMYFFEIFQNIESQELIDFLRQEIKNGKSNDLILAINALGSKGKRDEILLLDELRIKNKSSDISWAAKEAIVKIQSRLSGAESGMVSMSEEIISEGSISFVEDENGAMSLISKKGKNK